MQQSPEAQVHYICPLASGGNASVGQYARGLDADDPHVKKDPCNRPDIKLEDGYLEQTSWSKYEACARTTFIDLADERRGDATSLV